MKVRRWIVTSLVLAAMATAASCGTATTDTSTNASSTSAGTNESVTPATADDTVKKIFKENDTTIKVLVGEKFGIRLAENPSIGDSWQVISQPDVSYLKAEGDSYKSDEANPKPGAGGQREFKYKARAPGTTTITFLDCYRCGSSSTVSPENSALARRITFTVTVS